MSLHFFLILGLGPYWTNSLTNMFIDLMNHEPTDPMQQKLIAAT